MGSTYRLLPSCVGVEPIAVGEPSEAESWIVGELVAGGDHDAAGGGAGEGDVHADVVPRSGEGELGDEDDGAFEALAAEEGVRDEVAARGRIVDADVPDFRGSLSP